jgi:hypothetical protein
MLRLGFGGQGEAEGKARSAEASDEVEALASVAGAHEEEVGDSFGDEA